MSRHTIEQAIEDLRNGKLIIVADDEDRENEGDLVCAAELVTPEMINFMTLHGRGLDLPRAHRRALRRARPAADDRAEHRGAGAPRSPSRIDADRRFGVTTGISAADRATTIHVALNPAHRARRPAPSGAHLPAARPPRRRAAARRAHRGAASTSRGSPASYPAGVICEILNADGSMARRPQLLETARSSTASRSSRVAQLVAYRLRTERLVHRVAEARLPTRVRRVPHHRLPQRRGPRASTWRW